MSSPRSHTLAFRQFVITIIFVISLPGFGVAVATSILHQPISEKDGGERKKELTNLQPTIWCEIHILTTEVFDNIRNRVSSV